MEYPDVTVQSQYAASQTILDLVEGFNKQIDPKDDIALFYAKFFNVQTADGVGLDVWGNIVNIGRLLNIPDASEQVFGFKGSGLSPFNQFNFYVDGLTKAFYLTDEAYRQLILLKAASNIGTTDAKSINNLLSRLFNREEKLYVIEIGIMQIRFVFEFYLMPVEQALFKDTNVILKGAGVGLEVFSILPKETFGFLGSDLQPFNQGGFLVNRPQIAN